jgi:deoxyxylulose-5-phosphate synthase
VLRTLGHAVPLLTIALHDGFVPACSRTETHRQHGLDGPGISARIIAELGRDRGWLQHRRRFV